MKNLIKFVTEKLRDEGLEKQISVYEDLKQIVQKQHKHTCQEIIDHLKIAKINQEKINIDL